MRKKETIRIIKIENDNKIKNRERERKLPKDTREKDDCKRERF